MMGRKTLFSLLLAVVLICVTYWISTYFMAYTDDAFVTTDLVRITPQVSGHIVELPIEDNQFLHKGDLLLALDPQPFQLQVDRHQAELDASQAKLVWLTSQIDHSKANVSKAQSALNLAKITEARKRTLLASRTIAPQDYDEELAKLKAAEEDMAAAQASLVESQDACRAQEPVIKEAQAALNNARYNLSQTSMYAPLNGFVTALKVKPGDYAKEGDPVVGLVSNEDWHLMANYQEYLVRHMEPGQRVIVYLDGHPWRLFRGRVHSVSRGVSRIPDAGKLLPYVEPKTNWIRLARRFPVRIELTDPPADLRLHMGGDARTLVVY